MTYQLTLPPDIERRLSARASESGQDVLQLIQAAVVQFVADTPVKSDNGNTEWSSGKDARRCELIDRDISGTISDAERQELAGLELEANAHFDAVAPPPIEGARRIHQQLLSSRARRD